ncbi:uncharacterized protein KY384_007813 [Bacidia gigantensis]|uniref:uncharacterized protein n=1 Tax=Bacidia gigantensis TaxID=2732470 RepID=UPI001D0594A7|nr:uncharacterized protein KY384_007813 [Bacidia gigantensis]KAG8527660.1 hypothetical protein KY384_007813 [Bacidia gigantensis]
MKSWNEAKALEDSQESLQFSALSIAIYFFVSSRLAGVEIKSDEWRQKTNIGLSVINELFHEGFEVTQISESDVQLHMRQIAEHRWTDMDWFYNIELGSGVGIPLPDERNSQGGALRVERNERQEFPGRPKASTKNQQPGVEFLQPGLGTMMQRSVDYLSDERLRDYEMWETDIRLRIKEAETVSDAAVDIDAS